MPLDPNTGWPSDSALDALLERLGIPYEPALAVVDSGCALGGTGEAVPQFQRVTCHMRGNAEPIELEFSSDDISFAKLRVFTRGDSSFQQLDTGDHEEFDTRDHYLFAVDVDGDGTRELLLRQFRGATGNTAYHIWRFDAATRRLTLDSALTAMPNLERWPGRPCVTEGWHGGGAERATLIQCMRQGRWHAMSLRRESYDAATERVIREMHVLLGDSLRIVRMDTLPPF